MAVFFDATATSSGATTRAFHDLEYRWDFGDPAAGATWAYGSGPGINSKTLATGPVAAHVFESPGVFNVCLSVSDGSNTSQTEIAITVENPNTTFAGTSTLCVDSLAVPTAGADGCPAGAAVAMSSDFDVVGNTIAGGGTTHKRILFRRDRTYVSSAPIHIFGDGPGMIGAYGSGSKPVIDGASAKLLIGTPPNQVVNPNFHDWRIVDLHLDGVNRAHTSIQTIGPFRQVTLLRLDVRNALNSILLSKGLLDDINLGAPFSVPLWSELSIAESTLVDQENYAFLGEINRLSFLGSYLANTTIGNSHLARVVYAQGAVISNNDFDGGSPGNSLTIRALPFGGDNTIPPQAWTEKVVVSDNKISGGSGLYFFTIMRVNNDHDVRLRNILVERNWLIASASTEVALNTDAGELTVRNNLFNLSGAQQFRAIYLGKPLLTPSGMNSNISIVNNTAFASTTNAFGYNLVRIVESSAPANLTIKNNISYTPNLATGTPAVLFGAPGSGADISNNTDGASIITVSPSFATTPPTAPTHFRPTAGSYAIGAGVTLDSCLACRDFFDVAQPSPPDMGAVVR